MYSSRPRDKIIDVFICKLRKKLAVYGAGDLIVTVWGRGYMMRDPLKPGADGRTMPHMAEMGAGTEESTEALA